MTDECCDDNVSRGWLLLSIGQVTTILPKDGEKEQQQPSGDLAVTRAEQLPVARIEINLVLRLLEENEIIEQRQNEALEQLLCLLQVNILEYLFYFNTF